MVPKGLRKLEGPQSVAAHAVQWRVVLVELMVEVQV